MTSKKLEPAWLAFLVISANGSKSSCHIMARKAEALCRTRRDEGPCLAPWNSAVLQGVPETPPQELGTKTITTGLWTSYDLKRLNILGINYQPQLLCRDSEPSPVFIWVVVSGIFHFHPYLRKWSNLTNILQFVCYMVENPASLIENLPFDFVVFSTLFDGWCFTFYSLVTERAREAISPDRFAWEW